MRKWIILVLFSILLSYPAVSGAADDTLDPGRAYVIACPILTVPIGAGASEEKKGEEQAKNDDKKQKDILDKKVDDAIKKAWGEN